MNHTRGSLLFLCMLGWAVAAACNSRSQTSAPGSSDATTGQVGLALSLPGGAVINTVHVVISGPTPKTFDQNVSSAAGVVQADGSVAINLGTIAGLAPGAYTVAITATSTDGTIACTGAAAPFVVSANATATVTAYATCRSPAPDSGEVTVGGRFANCGRVNSLADNIGETTIGDGIMISGSVSGPNPGELTWSFSASPADGTLAPASGTGPSAATTFTCTTSGTVVITLTASSDGTLPSGGPPCSDVNTKTIAVVCDAPGTGSGSTTAAADAVCARNNMGGPCTPTELLFVAYDADPRTGLPKGSGPAFGCYNCLVAAGCLDDRTFATDVNHECGDVGPQGISQPTLTGDPASTSCLNVVSCVLGSNCDSSFGDGRCFCGTAVGQQCLISPNGPCLAQEQDGFDSFDPVKINNQFSTTSFASGMANAIFACAAGNACNGCFPSTSATDGGTSSSGGSSGGSSSTSGSSSGSSSSSSGSSSSSSGSSGGSSGSSSGSGDGGSCSLPVPTAGPGFGSVHCAPNNGGKACTPTEQLLIEKDTNLATGLPLPGYSVAFGCYDCLVGAGCLDDTLFASDVDHECGDVGPGGITQPRLSGDSPSTSCLNVLACVLGCNCASSRGDGSCYCGTAVGSACTAPGGPNGPCLAQEQDGLDTTNPPTLNARFTDTSYAAGMANTIMSCGASNACTQCFP